MQVGTKGPPAPRDYKHSGNWQLAWAARWARVGCAHSSNLHCGDFGSIWRLVIVRFAGQQLFG